MFSLYFCNLTIAVGEVGVPASESKIDWPGTESKWTFFFFFWQVRREIKMANEHEGVKDTADFRGF